MKTETQITRLLDAIGYDGKHTQKILSARLDYWRHVVGPLYAATDPQASESVARLLERVKAWQWGGGGLALIGNSGRGKSRAMAGLMLRVILEAPFAPTPGYFIYDAAALVAHERGAWKDATEGVTAEYGGVPAPVDPRWVSHTDFAARAERAAWCRELGGCIREYARADYLLIDDLGQAPRSEVAESALLAVLEQRLANGRHTSFTSQFTGDDLAQMFSEGKGAAIVRRARELTTSTPKND